MPAIELSADDAWVRMTKRRAASWHGNPVADSHHDTALVRLRESVFRPELQPRQIVRSDDKLFAIGSCFARSIEHALALEDFNVVSQTSDFDQETVTDRGGTAIGFMNRYNPYSIVNELHWALDPAARFPQAALLARRDETYVDPHSNPALAFVGLSETLARRAKVTDIFRRVAGCQVLVVTLGLIEAWYDQETSLYTNMTPPLSEVDHGRFVFRVMSFEEVMAALESISRILATWGWPDVRIVVTVSPVPLLATFTGEDIVSANCHSKSLLRAAAAEWSAQMTNISYFPSYEIVMNSDREQTWEPDGRHVKWAIVQEIMQAFRNAHVEAEPEDQIREVKGQ